MSFEIRRIDHVVLRVRDMPGMIAFYEQALGCKVERRLDRISLVQLRAGDCLLDLVASEQRAAAGTWITSAFASIRSIPRPSPRG